MKPCLDPQPRPRPLGPQPPRPIHLLLRAAICLLLNPLARRASPFDSRPRGFPPL